MCDQYYQDTQQAVGELGNWNTDSLNDGLVQCIDTVINECGMILERYEEKDAEIDALSQLLTDNDIDIPSEYNNVVISRR